MSHEQHPCQSGVGADGATRNGFGATTRRRRNRLNTGESSGGKSAQRRRKSPRRGDSDWWLLLCGGVAPIAGALFVERGNSSRMWSVLLGVLYAVGGFYFVTHPLMGLGTLTLFLAAILIIEAAVRVLLYVRLRAAGVSGWLLVNAVMTFVLGCLIWFRWRASALWAIGLMMGVNLVIAIIEFQDVVVHEAWNPIDVAQRGPLDVLAHLRGRVTAANRVIFPDLCVHDWLLPARELQASRQSDAAHLSRTYTAEER